uniref:ATP synthase complex subunit 8 n=1 Tax=Bulbitermes singaporiensis TaxID=1934469 RepID=A0A1S5VXE6_9NEOP|nr:ATP synthase F0 subunit 8 [Bulbitermes singaporiensis]AQP30627.1 ATP synthase F0 subunit 8 [Bulbitermes singaporiensis]
MPQMMPMEWTLLYITFMMTFLMFNIMNYFGQSPNKQSKTKKSIKTHKTIWKW